MQRDCRPKPNQQKYQRAAKPEDNVAGSVSRSTLNLGVQIPIGQEFANFPQEHHHQRWPQRQADFVRHKLLETKPIAEEMH